jgi:hypothetical protein
MNNQIGNRDKKIAILLIAAFAWLFIGSLIIFHEEQVFGKHLGMVSQLFVSPKSNEKKDQSFNIQKTLVKIQDNGLSACFPVQNDYSSVILVSFESQSFQSASFLPDDVFLTYSALRAPPVA